MFSIDDSFFEGALFQCTGNDHRCSEVKSVSGGDINDAYTVTTNQGIFFIKTNGPEVGDMFQKEALGMQTLRETNVIDVPMVIGHGQQSGSPFLVLEHIQKGAPQPSFWEEFGKSMAELHRHSHHSFGLDHDNFIGRLPQKNTPMDSWIDFFIENRLEVQLGLAIYNGHISHQFAEKFRMLYSALPGILPEERPALIHGDLWSGNFMCNAQGKACIYDPAIYFGHREMELAFTRLFGGFDRQFYEAYHGNFPLEPDFEDRVEIYNLYPLLVHVNLFGPSYLSGIKNTINRHT